jgi:homoserine O-succinyltransferase
MTVVLPRDYHARGALERRNVLCTPTDEAQKEDIRALRIGILNIMPQADTYEFNLLLPMSVSVLQIEPVWIRLKTHEYRSTNHEHLDSLYSSFKETIDRRHIDGLIITGAPVEEIPFEEISYWNEITRIIKYARNNIASTLGICWGALALAKCLGIEKQLYPKKVFGMYRTKNLNSQHPVTGGMDDEFWCPQSRHSGIADADLEKARDEGIVNLLAYAPETGYTIFESADHRFIMHLGHPEYNKARLVHEYTRDKNLGRADVLPPANFDVENPKNLWRSHRIEFFSQWIKYVHETSSF